MMKSSLFVLYVSLVMLFFTNLKANELPDEAVVAESIGIGLSVRQAKINAYENFLTKIFNPEVLEKLGFQDASLLSESAFFITVAIRKVLLDGIEYEVPFKIGNHYQSRLKLNRKGLKQIYEFMQPRISTALTDLNAQERQASVLESSQLAMLLYAVYQKSRQQQDKKMLSYAVSRIDYYIEKDTTGLAIFPDEIFAKGELKINGEIAKSNEVFLPQGRHNFRVDVSGYFPVSGHFYLSKEAIKNISISLIKKPEEIIPISVTTNFSNELRIYKKRILESYGWEIDQDSPFIIDSNFKYTNEGLKNNFIKRQVRVFFSIGEKEFNKKNRKYFLKPGTEIYQQEYKSEFTYSKNDLVTLARQQRLLTINALLAFLSNFDEQDYRFLYFEQAKN